MPQAIAADYQTFGETMAFLEKAGEFTGSDADDSDDDEHDLIRANAGECIAYSWIVHSFPQSEWCSGRVCATQLS